MHFEYSLHTCFYKRQILQGITLRGNLNMFLMKILFLICHVLHLYLYVCGFCLFLSLVFSIYSLVLLWILWTCTTKVKWSIQADVVLFVHIYIYGLLLYICSPMFKKNKLSIESSSLLMVNCNVHGQWAFLYSK